MRRAEIIDLMAHHDPIIGLLVGCRRDVVPMGDRDLLDPLHPDRIVDVPELVDVLGASGESQFEAGPVHFTWVRMNP